MPGAPYQGLANGYGPPKSDHGQTQSRPPQPPGPIGPEMSMDVAADAHLPQTLQRDPLMADETGYSEEDNRTQALRDMELYREGLAIIFRVSILLLFKMKFNLGTNAKSCAYNPTGGCRTASMPLLNGQLPLAAAAMARLERGDSRWRNLPQLMPLASTATT